LVLCEVGHGLFQLFLRVLDLLELVFQDLLEDVVQVHLPRAQDSAQTHNSEAKSQDIQAELMRERVRVRAQARPGVTVPALVVGDLGVAAQLEHLLVATLHPRHLVQGLFHLRVPDQDDLKKTVKKNEDEASSKRVGQPSRAWVGV
jgi:hypothetical protein